MKSISFYLLIMWMQSITVQFWTAVEESGCLDTVICNFLKYFNQILIPTAGLKMEKKNLTMARTFLRHNAYDSTIVVNH